MTCCHVLVVEDDAFVLMSTSQSLREAGFTVMEAETADAAEALLRDSGDSVAVVFTDIEMPGRLDGISLAWEIRRRWPGTAVVLASGRIRPPDSGLPSSTYFVPKPYDLTSVSALIGRLAQSG